jgi:CubicO group peptidase (beta-lactamase class C family)
MAAALLAGAGGIGEQAQPWLQYVAPEEAGFSSTALEEARKHADDGSSGAVMAIFRGRVLVAWGDVRRELGLHSVRKSLISALYGVAVGEGTINLDATLDELGIDDEPRPLTAAEKKARIRDLIAARSGVYLPAAYAPAGQDAERPARGSHAPGTHFFYNNWDFNVAGVVYERLAGQALYEAFAAKLARPLGMEDWSPADGILIFEPGSSQHPAHAFRMSARDLARFGQLYLQRGLWNGTQVVPEAWVRESTKPISNVGPGRGYGYLWWTYDAGSFGERYGPLDKYDAFAATGSGGQLVAVIPALGLVVVHRGDTDNNRPIGGGRAWTIVARIVAARTGEPTSEPRLGPLTPVPFASQLPAVVEPPFIELPREVLEGYYGEYDFGKDAPIRIFEWRDRPFVFLPGEGEGELFAVAKDSFTIRVMAGVRIGFVRDATGVVSAVVIRMGDREIRAAKIKGKPRPSRAAPEEG